MEAYRTERVLRELHRRTTGQPATLFWSIPIRNRGAAAECRITESQLPVPGDHELGTIKKLGSSQKGPSKIGAVEYSFEEVRALKMST